MVWVAFDTETYLIQDGLLAPRMVCLSWYDGEDGGVVLADDGCALLHEWLDDPSTYLVSHQVDFDIAVCMAHDPTLIEPFFKALRAGRIHDTKVREKIINLAFGDLDFKLGAYGKTMKLKYSLAELVMEYFKVDISATKKGPDIWRLRYAELDGVPVHKWPEDAVSYAFDDAKWTWEVHREQARPRETDVGPIAGKGIIQAFPKEHVQDEVHQVQAMVALHLMSCWGMRTDKPHVDRFASELAAEVEKLEKGKKGLVKTGILQWDAKKEKYKKDTAILKQYVTDAYDGDPPMTPAGNVKTDKETIEAVDDKMLSRYVEWNHLQHLNNTYIPVLIRGTKVPLNPRYDTIRETGRTSCWNPNIQNQPRVGDVRTSYVPRPGYYYIDIDYDTFELRSFAQVALNMFGWSKMADALNAGHDDLHLELATEMLPYDYAYARDARAGKHGKKVADEVDNARDLTKVIHFGRPGGLVPKSFPAYAASYNVECDLEMAEYLWEISDNRWPEIPLYLDTISNYCGFGGEYTLIMHWTGLQRGRTYYTSACNCAWQALAAAAAKLALFNLAEECYTNRRSPLWNCRPVAFIHDQVLIEAPIDRAPDAAWRATEIMIESAQVPMPDVPIQATPALTDRWYKKASAVYDGNGNLTLWEP